MIFVRPLSIKRRPFKLLKKLTFSEILFGKIKKLKTLNLTLVKKYGVL